MKTVMEYGTLGDPSLEVGGEIEPLLAPIHVQLDTPKSVSRHETVPLNASCTNFEGPRDVLLCVGLVSSHGQMLFYPDWEPELALIPLSLEAGFAVIDFELTQLDTSLCQSGYHTLYIGLFDAITLQPVSNLGGSCIYVR